MIAPDLGERVVSFVAILIVCFIVFHVVNIFIKSEALGKWISIRRFFIYIVLYASFITIGYAISIKDVQTGWNPNLERQLADSLTSLARYW